LKFVSFVPVRTFNIVLACVDIKKEKEGEEGKKEKEGEKRRERKVGSTSR